MSQPSATSAAADANQATEATTVTSTTTNQASADSALATASSSSNLPAPVSVNAVTPVVTPIVSAHSRSHSHSHSPAAASSPVIHFEIRTHHHADATLPSPHPPTTIQIGQQTIVLAPNQTITFHQQQQANQQPLNINLIQTQPNHFTLAPMMVTPTQASPVASPVSASTPTAAPASTRSTPRPPPAPPREETVQLQAPSLQQIPLPEQQASVAIQLRWDAITHASSYVLERRNGSASSSSDSSDIESEIITQYSGMDTSHLVSNLDPNRAYEFRIRCLGGRTEHESAFSKLQINKKKSGAYSMVKQTSASSSSSSSAASPSSSPTDDNTNSSSSVIIISLDSQFSDWFTFKTAILPAPQLSLSSRTKNSFKLTWNDVTAAKGYQLFYIPATVAATSLTPSKGKASSIQLVIRRKSEQESLNQNDIDLETITPPTTTSSADPFQNIILLAHLDPLVHSYSHKGLKPGHSYHFAILALGSNNDGSDDSILILNHKNNTLFTVTTTAAVPSAPAQITRVKSTSTSLTIQWTPSADNGAPILDYTLQKAEVTASSAAAAAASAASSATTPNSSSKDKFSSSQDKDSWSIEYNGSNCTHTINNLIGGAFYKFRVKASNNVGSSLFSIPVCFSTNIAPPDAPGNIKQIPIAQQSSNSTNSSKSTVTLSRKSTTIKCTWDAPLSMNGSTQLLGYIVALSICHSSALFDTGRFEIVEYRSKNTSLEIHGLQPGTTYFAKVCAESEIGRGPFSLPAVPLMTLLIVLVYVSVWISYSVQLVN